MSVALRAGRLAGQVAMLLLGLLLGLPREAASQQAATPPAITLEEARQRVLLLHPHGVAARGQVEAASWQRRTAVTDLITPELYATTSFAGFSTAFPDYNTGTTSAQSASAVLQASYTVLGRGKFSELKRAGAALDEAVAAEGAAALDVQLTADRTYFGVLADRELRRVAADRLERAREQLDVARVRVGSGATLATDSLQLVLELNRARLALLRSDSALAVSRLTLASLVGAHGAVDAAPVDTMDPAALPFSQDEAIAELHARGPVLIAARAQERSAGASLGKARSAYLPEITVAATVGRYDTEFFPSALDRSQFLVHVSLPLWNGGHREVAVARARVERDVARAEREQRERAAAADMAAAYNGYENARAAIELAQAGVAAAAETYRVQRVRYREGSTTILDLLEAQVALSEAEAALVQSRFAARLSLAQLEALLGRRIFNS